MTGRFITFEGGEGAGKSTQIELLAAELRALGIGVIVTREPGGTAGGEAIRDLIVHGQVDRWSAVAESLLLNAARADHVQRIIRPNLSAGNWVIADRYVDSTIVYQGIGKAVDVDDLLALHQFATNDLWPDLTIVLDVDLSVAAERITHRSALDPSVGLRFEAHASDFHGVVANGFRKIAAADTARCRLVDANGTRAEVQAAVFALVAPLTETA